MTRSSLFATLLSPIALLLGALAAGPVACNGGDEGPSVDVSIDSISPSPTYAEVETTVEFSIDPGSEVDGSNLEWSVDFGDGTTKSGSGTSGNAPYSWSSSGSFSVTVEATLDGTTVGRASRRVDVLAPIDLAVGNVRGRPANLQPGDQLNVQFDVENRSTSPVRTPFDVEVFLRPAANASVTLDELRQLDAVGSGTVGSGDDPVVEGSSTQRATVTITVPSDYESGEYRIVPWIRPEGQFADEDPENNFAVSSPPGGVVRINQTGGLLPDIDVDELFVVPDRAFPALNEFQRGFTVANKGDTDAGEVTTETFLSVGDKEIDMDDPRVDISRNAIDNVPADASVQIGPDSFALNEDIQATDGEKKVFVIVRASLGENSDEVTESNNVAVSDPPITVSDMQASGPDIVVKSFSVSPDKTYLGGSVQIEADIANEGNTDVSTFTCRLYLADQASTDIQNDQSFGSFNVTSLESGKSESIDRTIQVNEIDASPGTYTPYVYCDPNGALDETYRGNNTLLESSKLEITSDPNLDLRVGSVSVPQSVKDGDKTTISAEVCVTGANASGTTRAELYETVGTSVDFSADPVQTTQVPNVTPGSCRQVDFDVQAACENFEDTFSYGVRVDAEDSVNENDEMNNTGTGGNPLEVTGRYCSCSKDKFESNDRAQSSSTLLNPGKKSASICKPAGECDYYDIELSKNDSLRVETTFPERIGQIETSLFDPSGLSRLDRDTTPGRQRVATFSVAQKDSYIFSICGANSNSRNVYDFDVSVLEQPSGVDLVPRKIEIPSANTYSIGAKVQSTLAIHNIGASASAGFDVEFVITPDRKLDNGNDVPVNPSVVSTSGIQPASRTQISKTFEIPTSLTKGSYYLAATVDPSDQVQESDGTNNTAFSREFQVETRCYDPLEPNDSVSRATKVQSQSYNNLTACASEEDYYRVCPKSGKKFSVTTTYRPQDGDIDLELYDRNQQLIDSSATTGRGKETVSVSYVNGSQCYYIRPFLLTRKSQAQASYDMTVDINDVAPNKKCASRYEPNDDFSSATSLIKALQQSKSGTIDRCPSGDDDYYRVQLSRNQTVSFRGTISPSSQSGTLRLQLYEPNQQPTRNVQTAPGDPTAEISNYTAPTSGTYFLQLTLTGSTRNVTYKLGADGVGGIDLRAHNLNFVSRAYQPGESFYIGFDISNLRSATATAPSYTVYFSGSQTLNRSNAQQVASGTLTQNVSGNSTISTSERITIPSGASSGTHYFHVEVEPDSTQSDPNDSNDVATQSVTIQ